MHSKTNRTPYCFKAPCNLNFVLVGFFFLFNYGITNAQFESDQDQPNVVVLLADDLGYGDVGAYGAKLVSTTSIDRLAREGMRFTRAYTPSSVCSPTRYGLLTGRYAWRSARHPQTKVMQPGQPLAIEKGRETLATLFKQKGYATGVIGKWHLGLGPGDHLDISFDWNKEKIAPGPLEVGFDTFYGLAANVINQPRFFIENHGFAGRKPGDQVHIEGGDVIPWDPKVEWKNDEVSQIIADKAVEFIQSRAGPDKPPFFLYYAANIPHNPITPSKKFLGTSLCGPYGDFIQELDHQIGQILAALEKAKSYRETLVIFTSDNGGVATAPESRGPAAEPQLSALKAGHQIVGSNRGGKWSIYEGGFRVPFIVSWPGKVEGGQTNDNLISLVDVFATLSDFLGVDYGTDAAEDSFSFWPQIIEGPEAPASRDHVIVQSPLGTRAIVRDGWKYIRKWELPENPSKASRETMSRELSNPENVTQLYHLNTDPAETEDQLTEFPAVVRQLKNELELAALRGGTITDL